MQLTRQADYAVRAVLDLAQRPAAERVTTAEVGDAQHIPLTFLAKIMAQLVTAGIMTTTRGAHGGVTLARPPAEITLLAVIEAIEGPLRLNACVDSGQACPAGADCTVQSVWSAAQADLIARLHNTTFAALAQSAAVPVSTP